MVRSVDEVAMRFETSKCVMLVTHDSHTLIVFTWSSVSDFHTRTVPSRLYVKRRSILGSCRIPSIMSLWCRCFGLGSLRGSTSMSFDAPSVVLCPDEDWLSSSMKLVNSSQSTVPSELASIFMNRCVSCSLLMSRPSTPPNARTNSFRSSVPPRSRSARLKAALRFISCCILMRSSNVIPTSSLSMAAAARQGRQCRPRTGSQRSKQKRQERLKQHVTGVRDAAPEDHVVYLQVFTMRRDGVHMYNLFHRRGARRCSCALPAPSRAGADERGVAVRGRLGPQGQLHPGRVA